MNTNSTAAAGGEVSSPAGALSAVVDRIAALEADTTTDGVTAQILADVLAAFTMTASVRDPLPETQPESAQEALAVLAGLDQLRASLSAMEAAWQVTAAERIRAADAERGVAPSRQGRAAAQEIALARRVSPAASSLSLAAARRLTKQLPATTDLLATGAIPDRQATTIAAALDGADPDTCGRVDQWIAADPTVLEGMGHRRLRALVRELLQQWEPGDTRGRAERAARGRHVTMTPLEDGMARISATLRAIDATAVKATLSAGAESRRTAGARTPAPALEADLLVKTITDTTASTGRDGAPNAGEPPRGPRLEVGIVITDRALLGRADQAETAQLAGYGPVPAHVVTDTLAGAPPGTLREDQHPDTETAAVYRRLYTHPASGQLIAMESRARAFPAGLARMIRWRDGTCRTPWCNAVIRHTDHAITHHTGGPTSYDNGQGLCKRCNFLKEHGPWQLRPTPTTPPTRPRGGWHWTSPHQAQATSPTPHLTPPDPPRENRPPDRSEPPIPRRSDRQPDNADDEDDPH